MRWAVSISAVLVASCGRFDFDELSRASDGGVIVADASIDAAPCTLGPFSTPTTDPAINSLETDWGPTLSPDGLTLVFASDRTGSGDTVFETTRAAIGQPWTPPASLTDSVTGVMNGGDPYLSADQLAMYWDDSGMQVATRAAITDPMWQGHASVMPDVPAVYIAAAGPDLSPDALRLVFTATAASDGIQHMFAATRATPTDVFGTGVQLPGLDAPTSEQFGSMTADGLEVVFQHADLTAGLAHATRAHATDAFGAPSLLAELGSGDDDVDPDVSDDGRTLVFASDRAGGVGSYDLWFATRACL